MASLPQAIDSPQKSSYESEICVVGGGPAGATIARRLALLGHQVCLVEKATFPRRHIGESLPPGILPVLDALGLRQQVEQAGFLRANQAIIKWSTETESHQNRPGEPGFQVDRGRFDELLLSAAREAGVQVWQPATVSSPTNHPAGGWLLNINENGNHHTLKAHFLVDASGKNGLLPGKKKRYSEATLALYGYWRDAPFDGPETRVEAAAQAWYWGAPLPDGTFNACVFIDPKDYPSHSSEAQRDFYRQHLAASTLLSPCLKGTLITPVMACNASGYFCEHSVGDNYIRVGDAAFSIDPLSSQGVQTAMSGALQASIVVHTLLCNPANRAAAQQFYKARQIETVARNRRWAARFYAEQDLFPSSPFWQKRATHAPFDDHPVRPVALDMQPETMALDDQMQLSKHASIVSMPVIKGDWIVDQPALTHPMLERPVAFLGSQEVLPLLASITRGDTIAMILEKWAHFLPPGLGMKTLHWLWTQQILVSIRENNVGEDKVF